MSLQAAGILVCCLFVVVALVCTICDWDRENTLPKPHDDPRDWQGAFMKDWKR